MSHNKQPNILYIFADEWRAHDTGYAGDPNVKTPNLDKLASQSLNLSHAVSGLPVCCPYRASLMTGRYPIGHGVVVNDMELDPELPNLGTSFSEGGYDTAYIGKWHIYGSPDGKFGRRKSPVPSSHLLGFQSWRGFECNHDYWESTYYEDGSTEPKRWEGYDAFAQTNQAMDFIESKGEEDAPWLLMLSWGPPHFPLHTAPEEYRQRFEGKEIILRENVPEEHQEDAKEELRGNYAHIEALDDALGRLLETLDKKGADNTIVIFTSDHGDMFRSHGLKTKLYPFEESIRVPFLCRWPAGFGEKGRDVPLPIDAPDVMPTLLGLCDLPQPDGLQGKDYSKVFKGEQEVGPKDCAILNAPIPFTWLKHFGFSAYRGVRTQTHSYVRLEDGRGLLYDLENDPYQLDNLYDSSENDALQGELESLLQKRLSEIGDDFEPSEVLVERLGVGHYNEVKAKRNLKSNWTWPARKES